MMIIQRLVSSLLGSLADKIGIKYKLDPYKVSLAKAGLEAITCAIAVLACFALGITAPPILGIMISALMMGGHVYTAYRQCKNQKILMLILPYRNAKETAYQIYRARARARKTAFNHDIVK